MKDLSLPAQPHEEKRPEEEYPLIRRYGHNDVLVEWYPHFQSIGPIESIMDGAERYYKCKFAQQKLMDIKFCRTCYHEIGQSPWYFAHEAVSDRETYAWCKNSTWDEVRSLKRSCKFLQSENFGTSANVEYNELNPNFCKEDLNIFMQILQEPQITDKNKKGNQTVRAVLIPKEMNYLVYEKAT